VSGFCLTDPELPIIFINNSTAKSRQIFTLFHELAHLLFAENGMTLIDDSYIDSLPLDDRHLEIACNRIAAEVLVPADDFEVRAGAWDGSEEGIGDIADEFKVSREVIARKLLDRGSLSEDDYRAYTAGWNRAWLNRKKGRGGNYYATQIAYLGKSFSNLAFSRYYDGYCTLSELADHLGVKAKQVDNLEPMVLAGM
jgi:Zn-dependent peptidase ImmA (M78 family)